jgi:biotin transport system substrate-specific component
MVWLFYQRFFNYGSIYSGFGGCMTQMTNTFEISSSERLTSIVAQAGWIATFTGLTALGAQIEIPNQPIPFTLQTFFVLLSGAFLGARNGFLAQVLYIVIGAIGVPVFSGGTFGIARIIGFTGGYILSFPIAAAIVGYMISRHKGYLWTVFSMFLALVVIFTSGSLYLNFIAVHDLRQAFASGFLIFSWWDLVKLTAAATIYHEFSKRYKRLPS